MIKFGLFSFLSFLNLNLCLGYETDFRLIKNKYFSSSNNESYILNSFNTKNTFNILCKATCISDNRCSGYYINNESMYCNTLSNLGTLIEGGYQDYSYIKTINYNKNLIKNSSLKVYILSIKDPIININDLNTTIYIDSNHNIKNDDKYNLTFKQNEYIKSFNNLEEGVYEVRQNIGNKDCHQAYPGLSGNFLDIYSNGYANNVINYYHDGTSGFNHYENIGSPHGGYIDSDILYYNKNFSFLLNNNNNTYLSFYPGDNITLHFNHDIVFDSEGVDILFNIYNKTYTNNYAKVYGGLTKENMTFIDILNFSNYDFDLVNYNIELPLKYIKLEFKGTDNIHFNLKNILFYKKHIYNTPNSYHIKVNENSISSVIFINYCGKINCQDNCGFNLNKQDYFSCIHGCSMFEKYHYCDCETKEFKDSIFNYYNYEYVPKYCLLGCEYAFDNYLGKNYTVKMNSQISDQSILSINFDNIDLLDILVNQCNTNEECYGITLGDKTGYVTNKTIDNMLITNHSFISILKNNIPMVTYTSTETSTETSTATFTASSIASSTASSTATSTESSITSSTAYFTATSTATSTASSTATSTATSTESSTVTTASNESSNESSTATSTVTTTTTTASNESSTTIIGLSTLSTTQTSTTSKKYINITSNITSSNFKYYIIIIVGILVILLLLGFAFYKINRKIIVNIPNQTPSSFLNPIYKTEHNENNENNIPSNQTTYQDIYYQNSYNEDIDQEYLDIKPELETT